jgi:hypothetical protein
LNLARFEGYLSQETLIAMMIASFYFLIVYRLLNREVFPHRVGVVRFASAF